MHQTKKGKQWYFGMKAHIGADAQSGLVHTVVWLGTLMERYERIKARIRAKVEHPFHGLKNLFGHRKTRYRGLKKSSAHLFSLFALVNLVLAKRILLAPKAQGAS
jgi:IS5 family transposase